jgi:hypothetical protein
LALYLVERDLSNIPTDQLRLDQRDVASVCMELKARGRRIRYISSAVVPEDGRALDLFGAENIEVIKETHASAGVQYGCIVEVLDLTPSFIHRERSRSRRSLQRSAGAAKGTASDPRAKLLRSTDRPAERATPDESRASLVLI